MTCEECGSTESEFNERLGETCCSDCGLILSFEPYEQTVFVKPDDDKAPLGNPALTSGMFDDGKLGSRISPVDKTSRRLHQTALRQSGVLNRGRMTQADKMTRIEMRNVLWKYNLNVDGRIFDECWRNFRTLHEKHHLNGLTVGRRVGPITYVTLRRNGVVTSIKKHAKISDLKPRLLMKLSRKFNKLLYNSNMYQEMNLDKLLASVLERITSHEEFSGNTNGTFNSDTIECREQIYALSNFFKKNMDKHSESFGNAQLGACIFLATTMEDAPIKQHIIAEACEVNVLTIRGAMNRFYNNFSIDKNEMVALGVENFVNGVRL
jgi:transcription initiation factor TFIIIB Brf1 subunit/transcription initiation factor TFIIB